MFQNRRYVASHRNGPDASQYPCAGGDHCGGKGDRRWSWKELLESRDRLAGALGRLGIAHGEHVIIYSRNSPEFLLVAAAARAVGAIPVPMNHRLVADEVAYILDHSDASAVFVDDTFLPRLEDKEMPSRRAVSGSSAQLSKWRHRWHIPAQARAGP